MQEKTEEMHFGKYIYDFNPEIFKFFKTEAKVMAVTATNGKTMTNNAISYILSKEGESKGRKVISNLEGNNMETGILSILLKECTLSGKIKADYLVFEVDEGYIPITFKDFKLDTLVVSNFFRDQLDRNGEVESLILKINDFLKTYTGNLILNNDDPNVARLGMANQDNKNVMYYTVDEYQNASKEMKEAGEGKFCPFCSNRIEYEYYQYSHIGKFKCPNCNYGDNKIYLNIKKVDVTNKSFECEDISYTTKFNNIYSIYNFAAVLSVAKLYNLDREKVKEALSTFVLNNGRLEEVYINNVKTIINLAKNPTGSNVSIRNLNEDESDKELLFVLNDNLADGQDVSWIWDINLEELKNVKRIITTGTRAFDMAIRFKNSGFSIDKIESYVSNQDAVDSLYLNDIPKYVIANYTALQPIRCCILNKDKEKN